MANSLWYLITWGLVCAVWLAGALYNVFFGPKVIERRYGTSGLDCLVGIGLAVILTRYLPASIWASITITSPGLEIAGIVILVLSTAFVLWARWALGTLWASTAMVKQGHQLRTEGPYRITRNPIYTGLLGMALGTMLLNGFGIMLPGIAAMFVLFEFKIHTEQVLLIETFGEQFLEYKKHVPRLVPDLVLRRGK